MEERRKKPVYSDFGRFFKNQRHNKEQTERVFGLAYIFTVHPPFILLRFFFGFFTGPSAAFSTLSGSHLSPRLDTTWPYFRMSNPDRGPLVEWFR